jgi:hypothetical protein
MDGSAMEAVKFRCLLQRQDMIGAVAKDGQILRLDEREGGNGRKDGVDGRSDALVRKWCGVKANSP